MKNLGVYNVYSKRTPFCFLFVMTSFVIGRVGLVMSCSTACMHTCSAEVIKLLNNYLIVIQRALSNYKAASHNTSFHTVLTKSSESKRERKEERKLTSLRRIGQRTVSYTCKERRQFGNYNCTFSIYIQGLVKWLG